MQGKKNIFDTFVNNRFKFSLFLIKNLPMGFLAGLKITDASPDKVTVSIPFKYLNKNPFKSAYFAALSMAAELSTGVLGFAQVYETKKSVSMLLLKMKAEFVKKAVSKTYFTCIQGKEIKETIDNCIENKSAESITVISEGLDKNNNLIANFEFTWTFKLRNK